MAIKCLLVKIIIDEQMRKSLSGETNKLELMGQYLEKKYLWGRRL